MLGLPMSVYTHLSDDEFFAFCGLFGVAFKKAAPITQGIKNSNWFIQTDSDEDGEFSHEIKRSYSLEEKL